MLLYLSSRTGRENDSAFRMKTKPERPPTGREPDSPFEAAVIKTLRDHGWEVHPQVGVSGYRLDLGVVNPHARGRYLLGVECDGATYHSAASARDRDRLRQMILEGLGWKIHRIWSTYWWINPDIPTKTLVALESIGTRGCGRIRFRRGNDRLCQRLNLFDRN